MCVWLVIQKTLLTLKYRLPLIQCSVLLAYDDFMLMHVFLQLRNDYFIYFFDYFVFSFLFHLSSIILSEHCYSSLYSFLLLFLT